MPTPIRPDLDVDFTRKLVEDLKRSLAENTRVLSLLDIESYGPWIVMSSHELPMAYDHGKVTHTSVVKATRFPVRRQADVMALNTHDGTGEPFVSVGLVQALQRAIAREQEMLEGIEAVLNRQTVQP